MHQLSTRHVFMSYSRRDEIVMRRVVTFLRKQGINVWVDNEKLVPGTPIWELEIEKAIANAGAIVVLLSPDSKDSPWVRREIGYAEDNDKRIFPVLVAGTLNNAVPIRLTNHQRVDIRKNEEIGLNSMATALSFYLEDLDSHQKKAYDEFEQEGQNENEENIAKAYQEAKRLANQKAKQMATEKRARQIRAIKDKAETTFKAIRRFMHSLRGLGPSQLDILYWYVSLLGIMMLPRSKDFLTLIRPESYAIISSFTVIGIYWRDMFQTTDFQSVQKVSVLALYCLSVILQSWLISKYKRGLGYIWSLIAMVLPVGLAFYGVYLYNLSSSSAKSIAIKLLPILGYYIWVLIFLWIAIIPIILIVISYVKKRKAGLKSSISGKKV